MSNVEEFGQYLLLKKLGEDPLGETFRAGRLGAHGVEQVVLLRVFNGRTVNGPHLWQQIKGRETVQQALKSPHIGSGVDLGEVRGVPYAGYDYISGKSLAGLLVQASTENTPIPADHALLIAERLALALSVAYEARLEGERILHGFVVPQLVMISNEGEIRLLGFEAAPGLRDLAAGGAFGPEMSRYLAPEALAAGGGAGDAADDAYSLGVILYELLTCRPMPRLDEGGHAAVIDGAEIAQEGTSLPPAVAALLNKSLAPRGERIPDAVAWHKAIAKLLADTGAAATTFNLAFFMHNLFRTEIERESQEIEAERTIEIPAQTLADVAAGAAAAAAEPAAAPAAAAASRGRTDEDTASRLKGYGIDRTEGARGRTGLWAGLAALVVAALAVGGYFYFFRDRGAASPSAEPQPTVAETLPAEPPPPLVEPPGDEPPQPTGPDPEDMRAQLSEMIEARSSEMEAKLRAQYDERIRALQEQLQATQEAALRREAELQEQQRLAAERRAAESRAAEPPATGATGADETGATRPETSAAAAGAGEPRAAAVGTVTPPATTPPPRQEPAVGGPVGTGAAGAGAQAGGRTTTPAAPGTSQPATSRPPSTPPQKPAPPPEPKVRVGDLVSYGPGVTPPELIRMPDPVFPTLAKRLNKRATVEVRVLVDEKGQVREIESAGKKAGFGFDQAAEDAARRATYRPATKEGVRVKMWTALKVRFEP